jgi:altered-inheritance-of-mitochondria protein 5
MEGAVARLIGGGLQKSRGGIEEVEKQTGPKVQEAIDRGKAATKTGAERATAEVKEGASRIAESTKATSDKAVASTKEKLDQAGVKTAEYRDAAKAKADRTVADAKSGAHDAAGSIRSSGGTVDAARGALRDVISKGIEKGKEAVSKAHAAVGLAADKMESKSQSATLSHSSVVEKALHERYEKPDELNKSVEEALEERYKPIDSRDNTVLRGV